MDWNSILAICVLGAFFFAALVGIDSGGNQVAVDDPGALMLADTSEADFQTAVDAFVARQNNPLDSVPYFLDKLIANAGAPSSGTNAVKTLTIGGSPASGLGGVSTVWGHSTGEIDWSATNATLLANIQAALDALPNIRSGDITVAEDSITSGVGTITFTFGGYLARLAVGNLTVTKTAGTGTLSMAQSTTAGVTATARGAAKGSLLQDTTNGALYQNTGSAYSPTWSRVYTSAAFSVSDEQTGTGSAQNVAHGLNGTPSKVVVVPTDLTPGTDGDYAATQGTHTNTNAVVTVTSGKKFVVMAWL